MNPPAEVPRPGHLLPLVRVKRKRICALDLGVCRESPTLICVEDHLVTEHGTEARCVCTGEYSAQKGLRQISIVGIVSSSSKGKATGFYGLLHFLKYEVTTKNSILNRALQLA